ncbi:MAG: hypothetical protein ACJ74W_03825 [Pyrinomonadaceae bacterium]
MIQSHQDAVSYMPLLQTLIGGLLTFLGGLSATYLIQRSQRKADRQNLASAFYGEVSALLAIIEKRGYLESIEHDLEHMARTGQISLTHFKVSRSYFNVYEQNVGKIGLLPAPLPEKIVSFYTFVFAALEDFQDIGEGKFQHCAVSEVKEMLEELLDISKNVLILGKQIQNLIKPTQ